MIITVGGAIGSGKSTLARKLAEELDLEYCSVGLLMRKLAKERGKSVLSLSIEAERDPSIDRELDRKQMGMAETGDCVMDSRLGAYLLDADFSIWLDASPEVQAERIAGRNGISIEEAKLHIARREASEAERYREIYGIDVNDQSVYDLILNTDHLTKDEMLQKCLEALKNR